MPIGEDTGEIVFVYDGECPICSFAARALRIRSSVGRLRLIDVRRDAGHPLMARIAQNRLDLDEGMVILFGGRLYHGADALHLMALLGSDRDWFNRMNAVLFRSETGARLAYPLMRAARNLLVRLRGVRPIDNLGPG